MPHAHCKPTRSSCSSATAGRASGSSSTSAGACAGSLEQVLETSDFYRESLGPDAADADLADLPTLSKPVLMERFDDLVTDKRLRRSELEAFLDAADAGELYKDEYRLFSTSGASGVSGLFIYSQREFAHWVAVFLRGFVRLGVTGTTRVAGVAAPSPLHLSRQIAAALMAGREGAPRLAVTQPMEAIVDALGEYRPEVLVGYPSVIAAVAEEQLQGRLDIAPRVVVTASEVLTDEAAQTIESAWGSEPVNMYASTELGVIAMGSLDRVGMHVCEEGIVEVVGEDGTPVTPGEPGSRVLLTNLVNTVQPLIRYELTDSVVLGEGPDPSGRPYDLIMRVDGRSDDILTLPGRRRRARARPPVPPALSVRPAPGRAPVPDRPARARRCSSASSRGRKPDRSCRGESARRSSRRWRTPARCFPSRWIRSARSSASPATRPR